METKTREDELMNEMVMRVRERERGREGVRTQEKIEALPPPSLHSQSVTQEGDQDFDRIGSVYQQAFF